MEGQGEGGGERGSVTVLPAVAVVAAAAAGAGRGRGLSSRCGAAAVAAAGQQHAGKSCEFVSSAARRCARFARCCWFFLQFAASREPPSTPLFAAAAPVI